jgi:hypothetical protein
VKFCGEDIHAKFVSYLCLKTEQNIKLIRIMVPIANLIVEESFEFGCSTISTITRSMIDEWAKIDDNMPSDNKKRLVEFYNKFRMNHQGFAAVMMDIECESNYAKETGLEYAKKITDLLGIFSSAVLIPDIKCVSRIKGTENIDKCTILMTDTNNKLITVTKQIIDKASAKLWCISKQDIHEIKNIGLSQLSILLKNEHLNSFQSSVLNMSYLYSKAAFTSDPMAKVIYMLSALESILLKDENEPIQQNLSERIAIFSVKELSKRRSIIKNIKSVYSLRSKYLHHGHSSSELETFKEFYLNVWLFYCQLLSNINLFESRDKFLEAIDDHKLA